MSMFWTTVPIEVRTVTNDPAVTETDEEKLPPTEPAPEPDEDEEES